MLKYPNEVNNIDEYYKRIEQLYPVIVYNEMKNKAIQSLNYWDTYVKYNYLDANYEFLEIMRDVMSYHIYSWSFYSYLISENIIRKSDKSREYMASELREKPEQFIIESGELLGVLDDVSESEINSIVGDKRHKFAHSWNILEEFYKTPAKDLIDNIHKKDELLQKQIKNIFKNNSSEISDNISPFSNTKIIDNVELASTLDLHKELYAEYDNYINSSDKQKEEDSKYNKNKYGYHIEDIFEEVKNRNYSVKELSSKKPYNILSNTTVPKSKKNFGDNLHARITNIQFSKIISEESKTNVEISIDLSDIYHKNERYDKVLYLKYGCIVDGELKNSNKIDLRNTKIKDENIKTLNIEIPKIENSDLTNNIEFFISAEYHNQAITDKRKTNVINIDKLTYNVIDINFMLYMMDNISELDVDEVDYNVERIIKKTDWLIRNINTVFPNLNISKLNYEQGDLDTCSSDEIIDLLQDCSEIISNISILFELDNS